MKVLMKWVRIETHTWKKGTRSKAGQHLQKIPVYLNEMRPLWPELLSNVSSGNWAPHTISTEQNRSTTYLLINTFYYCKTIL